MGRLSTLFGLSNGTAGADDYPTTSVSPRTQTASEAPGVLLAVEPHAENGGMADMAGVLQSVHSVTTDRWGNNTSEHHSFELVFDEQIEFRFLAATERDAGAFRRRIASNYGNSHVYEVEGGDALPPIREEDEVAGAELSLRRHKYYPIHHRNDEEGFPEGDPYSEITSEMLSNSETRVVVQVVFKPVPLSWTDATGLLRRDDSVDDVAESLREGRVKGWWNPRVADATKKDKDAAKVVEQQRGQQAFDTNIRVLAISPDAKEAEARARGVANLFTRYYQATTEQGFNASPVGASGMEAHVDRVFNRAHEDQEMTLTVDELASAAHIPNADIETPRIDWRHQQSGGRVPTDSESDGLE